ncbi:hypothetical protein CLOSTHATH_03367 [Hungatella hathewayi DSM 13479]|uniref:Uncharacterized protein n=1 Tax=Hungatella hathewayi DSM 13479 TaxID=566550 RepID=D3AIC7_9FIRM|nr:hypothetical protein CLOSTHATH_03367 [Hungatella hathewayi DSM 13479]
MRFRTILSQEGDDYNAETYGTPPMEDYGIAGIIKNSYNFLIKLRFSPMLYF